MDSLTAAGLAITEILEPTRLIFLALGVLVGLVVGLIPGIGGLTALAVLIPFTYSMDAYSAMALLIGMAAVVPMSDVIPAVLFGVPGTVGCAATVLDGHPLAKKGQAARALGVYTASTLGGLFGAALLALSIPILRPVILYLGTPDLLGICIFGLSMVAALSGRRPLRGLAMAGLGLLIAMIGIDAQTGIERWSFGEIYLWDGVPLVPFALGLFAVPELAALMISRLGISQTPGAEGFSLSGQARGFSDVLHHWWLVLRCSWIGSALGAVPGMGAAVIDWIAYGHAARSEKNTETFGSGDIRGVIASEFSNNAREGGALIPTIAFGVPGSASMALLLGAFQVHGLVPGPEMLSSNLDLTYVIIGSLALGTVAGAIICVLATGLLVKLVDIRYAVLLPIVLSLAMIGAFAGGQRAWADLVVLVFIGAVGWLMRELEWPRAPLLLGLVLGDLVERYLFISVQLYGFSWIFQPVVMVMFALAIIGLYGPIRRLITGTIATFRASGGTFRVGLQVWFSVAVVALVGAAVVVTLEWPWRARIGPQIVGVTALFFAILALVVELFRGGSTAVSDSDGPRMDIGGSGLDGSIAASVVFRRGGLYFSWLIGLVTCAWLIGLLPGLVLFGAAFARIEGKESWRTTVLIGAGILIGCWLVFIEGLGIIFPRSILFEQLPEISQFLRELM